MQETIRRLLAWSTFASLWLGGAVGIGTAATVGPWLAVGARMYTGELEPTVPALATPWVAVAVAALLPVPFLWKRRHGWAVAATLPFALLPWWLLVRLYAAAAPS